MVDISGLRAHAGRARPMKCTLCNTVWDPRVDAVPQCSHTTEQWETCYARRAADGAGLDTRRMWLAVDDNGNPELPEAVKEFGFPVT
jgi:hypothetical protein